MNPTSTVRQPDNELSSNTEDLRKEIVVLLYNASEERDNKSIGQAANEIMELIQAHDSTLKAEYEEKVRQAENHREACMERKLWRMINESDGLDLYPQGSGGVMIWSSNHPEVINHLASDSTELFEMIERYANLTHATELNTPKNGEQ